MNLQQAIDGFFLVRRSELAATTQQNYRYYFNKLLSYLGAERPLQEISTAEIRAYLKHLRDSGMSERTVHDHWVACSSLWSFAAAELGAEHVVRGVAKPKFREQPIIPFTEEEVRAIVAAAEYTARWNTRTGRQVRSKRPLWKRDVAIILTLLDSGLRASELCALTLKDYDNETGRLHIRHGKGDKERFVFLGVSGQRAIWRYIISRDRVRPSDTLFSTKAGRPIDRNNLRHTLATIGTNAGVSKVHPHRFRHTFAINFLRNGGNIFELQRILGHEELDTVKIYLSLAQVDIQRAQQAHSPADNWRL